MTEPSAALGRGGRNRAGDGDRPAVRSRSTARQAAVWAVVGAVSYGLTLSLLSDTFFWFAIPGVLGLLVTVLVATNAFLGGADGRKDLAARYGGILLASAALVAVPILADVPYLYPLVGVGMMAVLGGGRLLIEQWRGARGPRR